MFRNYYGSCKEAYHETIAKLIRWNNSKAGDPEKYVLGVSGGKDSAVVLGLLVNAFGKDKVIGVLMPNGEQSDIQDSIDLCEAFDIEYRINNIEAAYEGILKSFNGERLNSSTTLTNIPPRLRMTVLYAVAQECHGRVIGTGNYSEGYVGYCTKWGDMACDYNPLKDFLSDEVIELGKYINKKYEYKILDDILNKPPSDGLCGKTDEDNLGFSYDTLNRYIRDEDKFRMMELWHLTESIETRHKQSRHKFSS